MFIKKLDFTADIELINQDLKDILNVTEWGIENQIGLTHRSVLQKNKWKDCVGSLYDREKEIDIANEQEFTQFNNESPEYVKSILIQFSKVENFKIGRVRFMRLLPKTGLTVHADTSIRYHLVLDTNPHAYIAHALPSYSPSAICYHIPKNGHFYRVDTTHPHFVYNGGQTPRIHLVICPI